MKTDIISEKFSHFAQESEDFGQGVIGDLSVRDWVGLAQENVEGEILVLDLDMSPMGGRTDIPIHIRTANVVAKAFTGLQNDISRFLDSGGVVITLLHDRLDLQLNNDTYSWLDNLDVVEVDKTKPRENIDIIHRFPALADYFKFVSRFEYGIRINENTVTDPYVLAKHHIDNEIFGISLTEYKRTDLKDGDSTGHLVLLPQPDLNQSNFIDVTLSLKAIGEYYHRSIDESRIVDRDSDPLLDLDYLLDQGETEVIEFKRQMPSHVNNIVKELVALANHRGGVLAVGITDDEEVYGVDDIDDLTETVSTLVRTKVDPALSTRIEKVDWEGEDILLVRVFDQGPLYSIGGQFYTRVGTTTDKLTWPEIATRLNER